MSTLHYDDISLASCVQEFKGYRSAFFRKDFFAAIAVALLAIPQAVAYSLVAGIPPSCGLFATIFTTVITAALGSSRHLVVGPSNAIAILLQSAIAEVLFTYYREVSPEALGVIAWQVTIQLTFLVGIMQVIAAFFKLGRLTQFVSHSVITAYLAGTALAVIITQSFTITGISSPAGATTLYWKAKYMITHLGLIHWPTLILGLASLGLFLGLKWINRRYKWALPAPLIMLIAASLIVSYLGLSGAINASGIEVQAAANGLIAGPRILLVGNTGHMSTISPILEIPFFDLAILNKLLPISFAIALLGILETASVAKSVAANSGQRLSVNQELFGLGMGNFAAAFIGAMPSSGSPSRSILNYSCGAHTRLSAIMSGFLIAAMLLAGGYWIEYIPLTSLAALLFVTASKLVDRRQFLMCLKSTRSDAMVLLLTIGSCLFFSIDIAFYIGVVISIILYLKKASSPQLREYSIPDNGKQRTSAELCVGKEIRVINVEGELFFGAMDLFQATLKAIAEDDDSTRVIILRLKNARDIDATACMALKQLHDYLKKSERHLIACCIKSQAWEVLCDSGIIEIISKDNLFIHEERHPNHSLQRALKRAFELIGEDLADEKNKDISLYTFDDSSLAPITLRAHPTEVIN